MATGEAICPFCLVVMNESQARVTGELVTDYETLLRHRQENAIEGHSIDFGFGSVSLPAGFRPIFYHDCVPAKSRVTLYADGPTGRVRPE